MKNSDLIEKVLKWGEDVGILGPNGKGTVAGQYLKVVEELKEVGDAWEDYTKADLSNFESLIDKLDMEIGDLLVTVILFCAVAGADMEKCLEMAYNKISKRKGKVVDGQFVKEDENAESDDNEG